nr:proline-rich receptor-like protein kinase PERK9 isoform X1 [Salvelinus alpinus]
MGPSLPLPPGFLLITTTLTRSSLRFQSATEYGAEPTPVRSDSAPSTQEGQRSLPTMAAQPDLSLKVQAGPVFRSPPPATESHRVVSTGPQTAVDADHQPAPPSLPPAAAQGSLAPVSVSLPPAVAQGPLPGSKLRVIPVPVRGASEANNKPPPAPDEEPSSSPATVPPKLLGLQYYILVGLDRC